MTNPVQKGKSKKALGAIGGGIAAVVVIAIMFVPMIPVSYQESYQTSQTKTTSYQVMEDRQNSLFSVNDYTLNPNTSYSTTSWVKAGHHVEFTASANDNVQTSILSSDGQTVTSRDDKSVRYGFTAPIDDNYQFVVFNPHNGFYGIGSKTVGLYSASATESWQELITKYQDTTEPVTETRTVTKNVSLIQMLTGNK